VRDVNESLRQKLAAARDARDARDARPPKKPHHNAHAAPAPRAKKRARQGAFLHALVRCFGNITAAAHASGIGRENHVRWHRESESYRKRFAKALAKAKQIKCDAIEAEIHRRGVLGWEEVTTTVEIDAGGKRKEKTVRRNMKDTVALIFSAKAEMPEKYRERIEQETIVKGTLHHEHEHTGTVAVTVAVTALRTELLHNDPQYLEFQRQRALVTDLHPGDVCPSDVGRPLEDGQAPDGARPSPD
jgi:hypothetical protein